MVSLKQNLIRRDKSSEEHILPLINVVFLLLIFFMIAGRLATDDPFDMKAPVSKSSREVNTKIAIVHLGKEGRVAFEHVEVEKSHLEDLVRDYLTRNPDGIIRLKVDGNHKAADVLILMTSLKTAGVKKVSLVTELENKK